MKNTGQQTPKGPDDSPNSISQASPQSSLLRNRLNRLQLQGAASPDTDKPFRSKHTLLPATQEFSEINLGESDSFDSNSEDAKDFKESQPKLPSFKPALLKKRNVFDDDSFDSDRDNSDEIIKVQQPITSSIKIMPLFSSEQNIPLGRDSDEDSNKSENFNVAIPSQDSPSVSPGNSPNMDQRGVLIDQSFKQLCISNQNQVINNEYKKKIITNQDEEQKNGNHTTGRLIQVKSPDPQAPHDQQTPCFLRDGGENTSTGGKMQNSNSKFQRPMMNFNLFKYRGEDNQSIKSQSLTVNPNRFQLNLNKTQNHGNHPVSTSRAKEKNDNSQEQIEQKLPKQLRAYQKCELATVNRVKIYQQCFPQVFEYSPFAQRQTRFLNIEGPEFEQDYSYFLVHMDKNIGLLEQGVPVISPYLIKAMEEKESINLENSDIQKHVFENFKKSLRSRDKAAEWRILQRISFHTDHAKNLVNHQWASFKRQNRHGTILPFTHSLVKIKELKTLQQAERESFIMKAISDSKKIVAVSETDEVDSSDNLFKDQNISKPVQNDIPDLIFQVVKDPEQKEEAKLLDPYAYNNVLSQSQQPQIFEKIVDPDLAALTFSRTRSKLEYNKSKIMKIGKTTSLVLPRQSSYDNTSSKEDENHAFEDDEKLIKSYMNADYINGLVKDFSEKSMIACQGPPASVKPKFWQMIWENKCPLIIMLCPEFGPKDKEECINYWHDLDQIGQQANVGPEDHTDLFRLRLIEKNQLNKSLTQRKFELIYTGNRRRNVNVESKSNETGDLDLERQTSSGPFEFNQQQSEDNFEIIRVEHLHHEGWQDDKAPDEDFLHQDINTIISYMEKYRVIRDSVSSLVAAQSPGSDVLCSPCGSPESRGSKDLRPIVSTGPIVIHCSAGIGRTGTLCAIFNIIESIKYTMKFYGDVLDTMQDCHDFDFYKKKYPDIQKFPLRISIFGAIRKLREQRMLMVKKECQYNFVYAFIEKWVDNNQTKILDAAMKYYSQKKN